MDLLYDINFVEYLPFAITLCIVFLTLIFVLVLRKKPKKVSKPKEKPEKGFPLAIIGMSCRMPKGVNSPKEFLESLEKKMDFIEPVPKERWNYDFYKDKAGVSGKVICADGGWIKPFFDFDYETFSFNKREAFAMDPQQKICLEVALETFEDANVKYKGTKTGVFLGTGSADFIVFSFTEPNYIDELLPLGSGLSIIPNRISHKLDLQGPSMCIDTACSSSGNAMYVATQSLKKGDCETALIGGIHVVMHPFLSVAQTKLGVASKRGRCQTFTKDADGYVRSEACGMVLVKPLDKAIRDGNNIYAVIKTTEANQDGYRSPSLSMPATKAQQEVLRKALKEANVKPEEIFYFEAHGTGTIVGDPAELNGITKVLCTKEREDILRVGSVKSNLGHTEFAAYVTSLIKVSLMLHTKIILPNIHFKDNLNPKIKIKNKPLRIVEECERFTEDNKIMCVSSYGIGGSNVCSVLQGFSKKKKDKVRSSYQKPYLYLFSAQTEDCLEARVEQFQQYSKSHPQLKLMYTLNSWKLQHYRFKTFAIGNTLHESKVFPSRRSKDEKLPVAFVFSGQGPQHYHMGRSMYKTFPVFREIINKCDKIYHRFCGYSMINDIGIFGKEIENINIKLIYQIEYTLPGIIFFQIALFEMYKKLGIVPEFVLGHSFGEISALYASGQINLYEALKITHTRTKLMKSFDNKGKMIAIKCKEEQLSEIMEGIEGIWIAAYNSPTLYSIGGKHDSIDLVKVKCDKLGLFNRILQITNAYHTPLLEPLRKRAVKAFGRCIRKKTRKNNSPIKMFSTVTKKILDNELTPEYLFSNIVKPVSFAPVVNEIIELNQKFVFYEISCHPVLSNLMKEIEGIGECFYSVRRPAPKKNEKYHDNFEKLIFLENFGKFCCEGHCNINWRVILGNAVERIQYLPKYPFQRKRCFRENIFNTEKRLATFYHPKKSLLGEKLITPKEQWRSFVGVQTFPWTVDHKVQNAVVFPAAGMTEMFLEYFQTGAIKNFVIERAIPVGMDKELTLVHVMQSDLSDKKAEIWFKKENTKEWEIAATCEKDLPEELQENKYKFSNDQLKSKCTQLYSKKEFYKRTKILNLQYGPSFQLIKEIRVGEEECYGIIVSDVIKKQYRFVIHPAILDNIIQNIIAAADTLSETFIPTSVESLQVFCDNLPKEFGVHAYMTRKSTTSIIANLYGINVETNDVLFRMQGLKCTKLQSQKPLAKHIWCLKEYQPLTFPRISLDERMKVNDYEETWETIFKKFDLIQKYIAESMLKGKINEIKTEKLDLNQKRYIKWGKEFIKKSKLNDVTVKERDLEQINDFKIENDLIIRVGKNWRKLFDNKNNELVSILFGDDLLTKFYRDSLTCMPYVNICVDIVKKIIKQINEKRVIKILEVGAGTGGFSATIFKLIEELEITDRVEYYFTDVSSGFFNDAEKRFSKYKFIRYKTFDLNRPIDEQGFFSTSFDFVFGFDGIHPCENLKDALDNINTMLVPNGVLCMIELTNVPHYIDFIFGLFREWWGFTDDRYHVCLKRNEWMNVLKEKGFSKAQFFANPKHVHSVIVSHKNSELKSVKRTPEVIDCNFDECYEKIVEKVLQKNFNDTVVISRSGSYPRGNNKLEVDYKESSKIGFIRSVKTENPDWDLKIVDVPKEMSSKEMQKYLTKIDSFPNVREFEFVVKNREICIPKIITRPELPRDLKELKKPTLFNEKTTYVLSGGLGALGFKLMKWMVEIEGARFVVLQSRSGNVSQGQERSIKELSEKFNCKIIVSKTNVTKKEDVIKCYTEIENKNFPKKKGIFHLAMVLRDNPLLKMTKEEFYLTYNTKSVGAKNLVESIKSPKDELEFIILFSSVSSTLGNINQSNYAAGNTFCEGYAFELARKGIKARTFNLPLIDGIGGVANDVVLRELFEKSGWLNKIVNENHVFHWIKEMLLLNYVHIIPTGSWTFKSIGGHAVTERISHLHYLREKKVVLKESEGFSKDVLINIVAKMLDYNPKDLSLSEKLIMYGVDSLLAVELSTELQNYGIKISQMEILSGITISDILNKAKSKYKDLETGVKGIKKEEKKEITLEEEIEIIEEDRKPNFKKEKKEHYFDKTMELIEIQTKFEPSEVQNILMTYAQSQGLFNLHGNLNGKHLQVEHEGKIYDLIDFGACAYLNTGELPELKKLVLEVFDKYGANSHSNAFYEPILVEETLANYRKIVGGKPVRLCLSTTFGNMDLIPSICEIYKNNVIIVVDQYAHNTLLRGIKLADPSIPVRYAKHLDFNLVESLCEEFPEKTIFYINDGIFSMSGPNGYGIDPVKTHNLCCRHENLEIYIDEAHGFGWMGKYGRGYFLGHLEKAGLELHPRMTVICSLRKAVSGYGAFAVFGSQDKLDKIQYKTPSWFFQTGNNPTAYALQLAQSRFLLSDKYIKRSKYVADLIEYRNKMIIEIGLDYFWGFKNMTPLCCIKVPLRTMQGIMEYFNRLYYKEKYYVAIMTWPSIPKGKVGIRFTTRHCHSKEDVLTFLKTIKKMNDDFKKRGI